LSAHVAGMLRLALSGRRSLAGAEGRSTTAFDDFALVKPELQRPRPRITATRPIVITRTLAAPAR
jgi:hypothetical protein